MVLVLLLAARWWRLSKIIRTVMVRSLCQKCSAIIWVVFLLSNKAPVKTPCIGVCSTGIGDTVCRGCKRFSHEVIAWNSYTQDERRTVLQRIDALLEQIVTRWVIIKDSDVLHSQLCVQQIKFDPQRAAA